MEKIFCLPVAYESSLLRLIKASCDGRKLVNIMAVMIFSSYQGRLATMAYIIPVALILLEAVPHSQALL